MAKDKGGDEHSGLSDEEWEAFQRAFNEESAKKATYKEPSARQRELTAKWKAEPPKDTGWRTDGPKATGWDSSSAKSSPGSGSSSKRKRVWPRNLAWALVATLITGGVIMAPKVLGSKTAGDAPPSVPFGGTMPGSTPSASGQATAPAAAAATTTTVAYAHPDDQYFDGSPSINWADGAQGIAVPSAVKVGNYSAKTVGDAETAMATIMKVADLDPKVLAGGEPTAVFDLLQSGATFKARWEAWAAAPSRKGGAYPQWFATRFDPKLTKFLGTTVKVNGSITAVVNSSGSLIVTGDYSFVYAVAPVSGDGLPDRSLVHRTMQFRIDNAGNQKYLLKSYSVDTSNDRCDLDNGFVNPGFQVDRTPVSGPPIDPYATTHPPVDDVTTTMTPTPTPTSTSTAEPCLASGKI